MTQMPFGNEEKKFIENYLKTYVINKKLLGIEKYRNEYFKKDEGFFDSIEADMIKESPLAKARMYKIRHFILELPNSDEKLFLYYHYVKGESTEKCAELLGISRRSAFRMRNRALEMAYKNLIP